MEIEVTPILEQDCSILSASAAELGPDAGAITWRNCLTLAEELPLIDDTNRDAVRDHFAQYGAWDREEIDGWTDIELAAMVWQEAAADVRSFEDYCGSDLAKYEAECERGTISGRLYFADDGTKAFIYLGV